MNHSPFREVPIPPQNSNPQPSALTQPHPQHLRRLPGSHVVLSPQGQVVLVLLAVHLLVDGLQQDEGLEVRKFPRELER